MIGFTMTARSNHRTIRVLLLTTALVAGCNQETSGPAAHPLAVGPVPATVQRQGNPAAGYDALVNQPYISCGMPYSAFIKATSPPLPKRRPMAEQCTRVLPPRLNSHQRTIG